MSDPTEKTIVKRLNDLGYKKADGKKIDASNWGKPELETLARAADHLEGLDIPKPEEMDPLEVKAELEQREFKTKAKSDKGLVEALREARLNFVAEQLREGAEPELPPAEQPAGPPPAVKPDKKVVTVEAKKDKKRKEVTAEKVKEAVLECVMGMFEPPVLMDIKQKMDKGEACPVNVTVRVSPTQILRLHAMIQAPRD